MKTTIAYTDRPDFNGWIQYIHELLNKMQKRQN